MMLEVEVRKSWSSHTSEPALSLAFSVQAGERLAIVGPSGSGKTTLLRMLAGLTRPDAGHIHFNGQIWFAAALNIHLPPQRRSVGLMFQEYALFPNMTVRQNLEYALVKNRPKAIVEELLSVMELEALAQRRPQTLSGGQQQRVALARTLVTQPALLLLDEPLSALDAALRDQLQHYILKMQEKYGFTMIWVTHNLEEVEKIANRVLALQQGALVEPPLAPPQEISGTVQTVQNIDNQQIITIVIHQTAATFQPNEKIRIKKT